MHLTYKALAGTPLPDQLPVELKSNFLFIQKREKRVCLAQTVSSMPPMNLAEKPIENLITPPTPQMAPLGMMQQDTGCS